MGKPTGFMEYTRETPPYRPIEERVNDWQEVMTYLPEEKTKVQAARCMDCGIPFCNQGCPLGNLIPNWNDLVYKNHWRDAIEELHKTNNFPEFTGRICPAPCEGACVLGINDDPVAIKQMEVSIIDRAFEEGWVVPQPPATRTGKKVAVIGSGPAGLAAAAQLNKAGHLVTVFERDIRVGGLLTLGIPDFKLDKRIVERRVGILEAEGITFKTGVAVGKDVTIQQLQADFDAIVVATGATAARDLTIPGRELDGIHLAMDFLTAQNCKNHNDLEQSGKEFISAEGKNVVIIGGGDTGADCFGTSIRHKAKSVLQIEFMPRPPQSRDWFNPWPQWPMIFRTSSAHQEGGQRDWAINTKSFEGKDGKVTKLNAVRLEWTEGPNRKFSEIAGSEFDIPADLVLLAIGFTGPEKKIFEGVEIEFDPRGNVKADENYMSSIPGIFAAGDARRGQSLVVWAIAEGRKAARGVDAYLMGTSDLPGYVYLPASPKTKRPRRESFGAVFL